jgi:hypothetical protein
MLMIKTLPDNLMRDTLTHLPRLAKVIATTCSTMNAADYATRNKNTSSALQHALPNSFVPVAV